MKKQLMAGAALLALFGATPALADPDGVYVAGDIGYHWPQSNDWEACSGVVCAPVEVKAGDNWAGFGRLGYRLNANWRIEAEAGYRESDELEFDGLTVSDVDASATSLMANVLYDFGNRDAAFRPFVGAGVGAAKVEIEDVDDTAFGWQLLAGAAWRMTERASLDLTYRYLNVADLEMSDGVDSFSGDFEDHSVTLGLRYSFGAVAAPPPPVVAPPPPPPPPAPPAPPPPPRPAPTVPQDREFVVYFDWDRSDLTAEAQSVVTQAANYAKSGRPTRILIVGHADTSGSAAYNIGLSNRRSRTVADALVAQGVNGGVISLDGKGETDLARATADGVREPLNRRATVGISFR
ncbi:OmpA family protein [Brevundimonas sp. M20]|uniref:OmpA family protein n=1 Tax=Brevundimonas sp. M20 TaxID=2591463 RepID=UPI001146CC3F|nr:OmpA family protein [Brevundimonas sp. M20]QDH72190.1 OmpA family protein [Brevundimonas sp. M20]